MNKQQNARWKIAAILLGLQFCTRFAAAQSTDAHTMPQDLRLIFPSQPKQGESTRVRYTLANDTLIVNYEVTTHDVDPEKMGDPEIYNGNVVELFICPTARPAQTPHPYYEFEVSRYDQTLQVRIDENGRFNEKWKTEKFRHSVTIQRNRPGWDAMMEIPLKDLGWKGDSASLVGNAFAILGARGIRRFYSAYLPEQQKPNFHQPNFFKPFPINKADSFSSSPIQKPVTVDH